METNEDIVSQMNTIRAPAFTYNEIKSLIDIIEPYKDIILNKACHAMMVKAKAAAWRKVTKAYNEKNNCKRTVDNIKMKWDNMKKIIKKLSPDFLNDENPTDVLNKKLYSWMLNADSFPMDIPPEMLDKLNVLKTPLQEYGPSRILVLERWLPFPKKGEEQSEESGKSDDEELWAFRKRSTNFSPKECRLLIQCVRAEKKHILCKLTNNKSNHMKNQAWERIAQEFNEKNSERRTLKMLQNKFNNMRKMMKSLEDCSSKDQTPVKKSNSATASVKIEPMDHDYIADDDEAYSFSQDENVSKSELAPDPLGTILNGNYVLDGNSSDIAANQQVTKLKLELLSCQLETAKLENQRLREKFEIEKAEAHSRSIESAMRLRAARLELVAAESKLPFDHPALAYTDQEKLAQKYT